MTEEGYITSEVEIDEDYEEFSDENLKINNLFYLSFNIIFNVF